MCELGIAFSAGGEHERAREVLVQAIDDSVAEGDRATELRARMELEYVQLPRTTRATADALLDVTAEAIPVLEVAGEPRLLGRALLLEGWIHGGRRGNHRAREEAAERALQLYKQSHWPTSTCLGEIANALYYGPTPISDAISRCEALLRDEAPNGYGRANIEVFLGGLVSQSGTFDAARTLISSGRQGYEELGHRTSAVTHAAAVLGDVELLAGDASAAEQTFRWACDELERTEAYSHLASRAGDLAEALYRQQRLDEAAEWVAIGETYSADDDVDARVLWLPVRAKITAQRGGLDDAIAIASEAVDLAAATDALNRRAAVQIDMGEVFRMAGRMHDAAVAFDRAIQLFEQKGNIAGAERVRSLQATPELV